MTKTNSNVVTESSLASLGESKSNATAKVIGKFNDLLAADYVTYVKTQHYHWNVTGPLFRSHHQLFEDQYKELALEIDEMAERIRTLGYPVEASLSAFTERSEVKDSDEIPPAEVMIRNLRNDHQIIVSRLKELMPMLEDVGDDASADFVVEAIERHEKTIWMLNSSL